MRRNTRENQERAMIEAPGQLNNSKTAFKSTILNPRATAHVELW